jgi:hypothetical protein
MLRAGTSRGIDAAEHFASMLEAFDDAMVTGREALEPGIYLDGS